MRRSSRRALHIAVVVAACAVAAFPFYWMLVSSLQATSLFTYPPHLFPSELTLRSYLTIFERKPLSLWIGNTMIVSIATTILSLAISLNAAYSLSRFRTRVNLVSGVFVLITQMLPPTLLVVPMYIIFRELRLLDSLFGLVVADTAFSLPLSIWMLKGFFDAAPREVEEAGLVDGCSRLGAFYRLVLPISVPGILVVCTFSFMVAWNEFFFARTLITSEENWVLSVGLSSFVGEYVLQWNEMLAAAVLFTLPPAILFGFAQRYLLQGLTGGAVKG